MTNPEKLYNLLRDNPRLSNPEIMEQLNWKSITVRKYKYLLKQRGFIAVDDIEGVIVLKEYSGSEDLECGSFKQDAYKHMFDICIARAESEEISTPQLISLIQELRLILKQII